MGHGPLSGFRIIEIAGLGAGPMATMMLADMGAEVIRIDRVGPTMMDNWPSEYDICARSRRSIAIDLRKAEGVDLALRLIDTADGLIEAFRPGVAERLGVGPEACRDRNSQLVYGRMTGWGQVGPLAQRAGHDLNYIALTGALAAIGRKDQAPTPPLNLLGDGTGAMLLAFGMVCGLLEATRSGKGQVIDAAMVDGASLVFAPVMALALGGMISPERGTNGGDSGAPYYDAYETADGKFVSVAAMEPQFYARLIELMGLETAQLPPQNDRKAWPAMKETFAARFAARTQAEWVALLGADDTCFAPVLTAAEAVDHPQAKARRAHVEVAGVIQPAPAPRFSRSGEAPPTQPPQRGRDTDAVLSELGLGDDAKADLRNRGIVT